MRTMKHFGKSEGLTNQSKDCNVQIKAGCDVKQRCPAFSHGPRAGGTGGRAQVVMGAELHWLPGHSPPAVWPGSSQAMDKYQPAALVVGDPLCKGFAHKTFLVVRSISSSRKCIFIGKSNNVTA